MKNYINKIKTDSKKILILEIFGVFILSLGFTLALNYISKSINASLTTANINVVYVGDSKITKDLFLPIKESEIEEYAAIANFTVKGAESNPTDKDIIYDITLTNIDITDGLLDENFKFELYKNNTKISEGNFSNLQVEKKEKEYTYYQRAILNENVMNLPRYNETADSFQIRIYILDNGKDQSKLMGQSFKANVEIATYTTKGGSTNRDRYTNLITIKCPINTVTPVYTDTSGANAPVLADGMIPVVYDEGLGYWIKADINAGWYNYTDKIWANAVMVKNDATEGVECSKSRSYYMNAPAYTPVKEEDILAYYVWIPRYKYKLFNATYKGGTTEQLIEVTFENGTSTTGNVTCTYDTNGAETCTNKSNGNWYTHPAFTMINASGNKTELKGIWVGKFETTGSTTTPTVKPGVSSLRSITVANMYNTGKLFRSTDYITSNGINQSDSHMMKNIEWGAVAYLKQSKYGLGITDITINNNGSFYTGGGTGTSYKTNIGQSTSGNITGVYDMSGGAYEYVMGNYNKTAGSSGLTVSEVPAEHIDIYSGSSVSASHLGDATGETAGWYSDYVGFVLSSAPWFDRGGDCSFGDIAGVFLFSNYGAGKANNHIGFRVVLSTTE